MSVMMLPFMSNLNHRTKGQVITALVTSTTQLAANDMAAWLEITDTEQSFWWYTWLVFQVQVSRAEKHIVNTPTTRRHNNEIVLCSRILQTTSILSQYYDMPRKPGDRIESAQTLGRKCWAFTYLQTVWEQGLEGRGQQGQE